MPLILLAVALYPVASAALIALLLTIAAALNAHNGSY